MNRSFNRWNAPYDDEKRPTIELPPEALNRAHTATDRKHAEQRLRRDRRHYALAGAYTVGTLGLGAAWATHEITRDRHSPSQMQYEGDNTPKPMEIDSEDRYPDLHGHQTLKQRMLSHDQEGDWARAEARTQRAWSREMHPDALDQQLSKAFRDTVAAFASIEAGLLLKNPLFLSKIETDATFRERQQLLDDVLDRAVRRAQRQFEHGEKEVNLFEAHAIAILTFARVLRDQAREHPVLTLSRNRLFDLALVRISALRSFAIDREHDTDQHSAIALIQGADLKIRQYRFSSLTTVDDRLEYLSSFQGSDAIDTMAALREDSDWFVHHLSDICRNRNAYFNTLAASALYARAATDPRLRANSDIVYRYLRSHEPSPAHNPS